ncbi:hypothetical protein BJF88_07995 [Cellulosimicrobium sp. CUA-896]|nr:hypothetical protein BJF88_07995 [Cellulosimicrobium sp. CUA-896]
MWSAMWRTSRHGAGGAAPAYAAEMPRALFFSGRIAGWGTTSGTRFVVGRWDESPFGAFADVMVEHPDGERVLLAPTDEVAELVASTYSFDRVETVPVRVDDAPGRTDSPVPVGGSGGAARSDPAPLSDVPRTGPAASGGVHRPATGRPSRTPPPWLVVAGPLEARLVVGPRTGLGRALRAVPERLASSRRFTAVTDPVARALLDGVRTRGSAGAGRVEHYGATDVHALRDAATSWDGVDLGGLAPVDPPVRFGFGSTPRRPAVTDVVTTIVLPAHDADA